MPNRARPGSQEASVDSEALDRLEVKARKAVEALAKLRAENEQMARNLRAAPDGASGDPPEQLQDELRLLHDERQAVRRRVEGLISLLEEAL